MSLRKFTVFLAAMLALLLVAQPGLAQKNPTIDDLLDALRLEQTITVMQQEGAAYGEDLADQLIPNVNRNSWAQTIRQIYEADRMRALVASGVEAEIASDDIKPILEYLSRDEVREIISLEISARRAFLDPDLEADAKARFAEMSGQGMHLLEQVDAMIRDSDLVEANVAGALNADLMFYRGLVDGGAFRMSEAEILEQARGNEAAVRASSREWLEAFLMTAYQPLEREVLEDYVAFWRSPDGRLLTRALFAGFDQMYEDISYLLGRAVAREMTSEDL